MRNNITINATPHEHNSTDTDTDTRDVDSNASDTLCRPTQDDDDTIEPWVEWIRRSTHEAETQMTTLGINDWVTEHRKRKWRWARKVTTEPHKWSLKALLWEPALDSRYNARRRHGRPQKRWSDDIAQHIYNHTRALTTTGYTNNTNIDHNNVATTTDDTDRVHWLTMADMEDTWKAMEDSFVQKLRPGD